MDEIEPKFGEWLRGIYASESNPHRDGMYVRTIHRRGRINPGKFYEVTDGKGAFWMYPAQSVERIAAALRSAQVPEGWVMVPVRATETMCQAAHEAQMGRTEPDCQTSYGPCVSMNAIYRAMYRAMLAAAPSAEGVERG